MITLLYLFLSLDTIGNAAILIKTLGKGIKSSSALSVWMDKCTKISIDVKKQSNWKGLDACFFIYLSRHFIINPV